MGGWWYYPQAKPSRSPYVILDSSHSAHPESPSATLHPCLWRRGSRCMRASPAPPALTRSLCCLSSLPPNLACGLGPLLGLMSPVCHHLLGTRDKGLGAGSQPPAGCSWGCPLGHRSDLLTPQRALVRGFCFPHQRPPLRVIVGTLLHCHPPSLVPASPCGHLGISDCPQPPGSPASGRGLSPSLLTSAVRRAAPALST